MADAIAALAELLKDDAPTAALAGERAFAGELPPAETAHMPRHAIVIAPSGGVSMTGGSFVKHDTQRVDVFAYGPTPGAAAELLDRADRALRQTRRAVFGDVLIHWVQRAGGFTAGRDRDAAWPRAFRSYQFFHSLEEV